MGSHLLSVISATPTATFAYPATNSDANASSLLLAAPLLTTGKDISPSPTLRGSFLSSGIFNPTNVNVAPFSQGGTYISKFYTGSLGPMVGGSGASTKYITYAGTSASNADLALGTSDFTIECWVYFNSTPSGYNAILSHSGDTGDQQNGWILITETTGAVTFYAVDGTHAVGGGWDLALNPSAVPTGQTWHHIAITRANNSFSLYMDGTRLQQQTKGSMNINAPASQTLQVAHYNWVYNSTSGLGLNGYMQDFRLYRGVAKYTGTTYTVPSSILVPSIIISPSSAVLSTDYTYSSDATLTYVNALTTTRNITLTTNVNLGTCNGIIVAGGGGGGSQAGAGGGGGGLLPFSAALPSSSTLLFTLGAGGAGGPGPGNVAGTNGSNSTVSLNSSVIATAIGGGGGGTLNVPAANGKNGGCGGGSGASTTPGVPSTPGNGTIGQGYAGGNTSYVPGSGASAVASGGGGGASAVGYDATLGVSGNGGPGALWNGAPYGGGGGGGAYIYSAGLGGPGGGGNGSTTNGAAGTNGKGGGGGGGGAGSSGGQGGSGFGSISFLTSSLVSY
jgi:hypothetical protein